MEIEREELYVMRRNHMNSNDHSKIEKMCMMITNQLIRDLNRKLQSKVCDALHIDRIYYKSDKTGNLKEHTRLVG